MAPGLSMAQRAGVEPDGPSYDDLYRAHRTRVLRLCRLFLGDPDEAEDVGQEVFVKLFRASQRPHDPEMAWGPWLTRVTVHACRDRRRSRWWRAGGPSPARSTRKTVASRGARRKARW